MPGLRGFSASSIKNMRLFYEFWATFLIRQPVAGEFQSSDNEKLIKIDTLSLQNWQSKTHLINRELNCMVVVELKKGAFKPGYIGQLQTWMRVLDDKLELSGIYLPAVRRIPRDEVIVRRASAREPSGEPN